MLSSRKIQRDNSKKTSGQKEKPYSQDPCGHGWGSSKKKVN